MRKRLTLNPLSLGVITLLALSNPITERTRITKVMIPIITKGPMSKIKAMEDQVVERDPPDMESKVKKKPIANMTSKMTPRGR